MPVALRKRIFRRQLVVDREVLGSRNVTKSLIAHQLKPNELSWRKFEMSIGYDGEPTHVPMEERQRFYQGLESDVMGVLAGLELPVSVSELADAIHQKRVDEGLPLVSDDDVMIGLDRIERAVFDQTQWPDLQLATPSE